MTTYYDRNGHPIDLDTYMRIASDDYRTVERTEFDHYLISTVWLGIDHSFGHGPPLIFETMIFSNDHLMEQARYSTEEEARAGHEEMVIRCQRAISYRFGNPDQAVQQP